MDGLLVGDPARCLEKIRDLSVIRVNDTELIVLACDSDGGIGNKPYDAVSVSEEILGAFAVRVPLFEIIACGATPFLVVNTLAVEMEPTGKNILQSLRRYASQAGLRLDTQFTGSTEENVPTVQTGVGVTVLGSVEQRSFFPGLSQAGDAVVCAGLPKSAPHDEVRLGDEEILSLQELRLLRGIPEVRDMIPVGSKGILYEARQLASSANLTFRLEKVSPQCSPALDVHKSAGPATCVLFTAPLHTVDAVRNRLRSPVHVVGFVHNETIYD